LKKGVAFSGVRNNIDYKGSPVKGVNKKQIETLLFKRWFGKSKVVDGEGRPLLLNQ